MAIEFVRPTDKALQHIALHMRQQDVAEIWASSHNTPIQSLRNGVAESDFSTVVNVNGAPVVAMGIVKRDLLTGAGWVWMLATDDLIKHRVELSRIAKPVINDMLNICPILCNMVHTRNKVSITWLLRLGFTLSEPVSHGPDGELFQRFHLRKN